jgi:glutathione S-transferase
VFFERGNRPPELVALGPRAKSPTLIDGDARVYDSPVVLEYLEDRYPKRSLMPKTPEERAEVRMLAKQIEEELTPKTMAVLKDPANGRAKRELCEELATWNDRLAGRAFAVGTDMTEADIMLYTMFPVLKEQAAFEVGDHLPHLRNWILRMAVRPTTKVPHPIAA